MYTFKNFTTLASYEIKHVFHLRNHPSVQEWMFNKNIITWEEHITFIVNLKNDHSKIYFYVLRNNEFIGVYSVNEMKNATGQGGFYISLDAKKKKLAFEFIYFCLEYVFQSTTIVKLHGLESIANKNAFTLNQLFGFYSHLDSSFQKINGEYFRYGELTQDHFESIAVSHKIQKLLKFSKSISYKFKEIRGLS